MSCGAEHTRTTAGRTCRTSEPPQTSFALLLHRPGSHLPAVPTAPTVPHIVSLIGKHPTICTHASITAPAKAKAMPASLHQVKSLRAISPKKHMLNDHDFKLAHHPEPAQWQGKHAKHAETVLALFYIATRPTVLCSFDILGLCALNIEVLRSFTRTFGKTLHSKYQQYCRFKHTKHRVWLTCFKPVQKSLRSSLRKPHMYGLQALVQLSNWVGVSHPA